jgi:hypothetical protein
MRTAAYYDVVNFARRVKAPGLYSWGWNDEVCPPTSTYAAYNVVAAPKQLLLAVETGHFTVPEQTEKVDRAGSTPSGRLKPPETGPVPGPGHLTQKNPVWYKSIMPARQRSPAATSRPSAAAVASR